MGDFLKGSWRAESDFPHDRTGHFVRPDAPFRNWVTASGEAGAERRRRLQGRARPLSPHRLARLPVGAPHPHLPPAQGAREHDLALGRPLAPGASAAGPSTRAAASFPIRSSARASLSEFYVKARPDYSGRVTVPVLWDKKTSTIVNNELSEIIRMFNSAFDGGRRGGGRLLSERAESRDRRAQRAHLRDRQQRRLSRRLRHHPGRPTRRRSGRCSRRSTCSRRGSRASAFCAASG